MPEEEQKNEEISSKEFAPFDDEAPCPQEESESCPQEEELSYVAIKGMYYTPKADNAGVFCVIFRGATGKVIFRELWAIRSNIRPISNLSDRWEDFIREMNKIGTYDKDSSDKLQPLIEKSLNNSIKEYLFRNIDETEIAMSEIRKELENSLHYLVEAKIEVELFGENRAERGGLLRNKEASSGKNNKEDFRDFMGIINLGGIPLICEPVIDPANGCPVSKINIGDIVHVSLKETNTIAKKVIDYVRADGRALAFPVTLVQALESGKCVILLKISDEISGVLNLHREIMLKTNSHQRTERNPLSKFLNLTNLFLGGMILIIAFLLYLIIRLI
jgi:hypothetical protein